MVGDEFAKSCIFFAIMKITVISKLEISFHSLHFTVATNNLCLLIFYRQYKCFIADKFSREFKCEKKTKVAKTKDNKKNFSNTPVENFLHKVI